MPSPNIDRQPPKAESDLMKLFWEPDGTLPDTAIMEVLRRYNLQDALATFGRESIHIQNTEHNRIGKTAIFDDKTRIFITQHALLYWANMFILSGANDHKSKLLSANRDNLVALCYIYGHSLIMPKLKKDYDNNDGTYMLSMMVRMGFEQMRLQFDPVSIIARSIIIYRDILPKWEGEKVGNLDKVFVDLYGLTIYEYLVIGVSIWGWVAKEEKPVFHRSCFTPCNIPQMSDILTVDKFNRFLAMTAADYTAIRQEDAKRNSELQPEYTKTRFNPLFLTPIVITDIAKDRETYLVPNIVGFVKSVFDGIFWRFDNHYNEKGMLDKFRTHFGTIFGEYVGLVLKNIFSEGNVNRELLYTKSGSEARHLDWWIPKDDKIYFIEAKAYQFALPVFQTGRQDLIQKEITDKIAWAIGKVFDRLNDIDQYDELAVLRGKRAVPIIVFMDMPYVSTTMYRDAIDASVRVIETSKGKTGLSAKKIYLMNIDELELYQTVSDKVDLEQLLEQAANEPLGSISSAIEKYQPQRRQNELLKRTFDDFFSTLFKRNQV